MYVVTELQRCLALLCVYVDVQGDGGGDGNGMGTEWVHGVAVVLLVCVLRAVHDRGGELGAGGSKDEGKKGVWDIRSIRTSGDVDSC